MPSVPTGGLSIFVNIAILVIGWLYKLYKKTGLSRRPFVVVAMLITAKKYDTILRRCFAYSFVFTLFTLMSIATAFSIGERVDANSNLELAKNVIQSLKDFRDDIIEAAQFAQIF